MKSSFPILPLIALAELGIWGWTALAAGQGVSSQGAAARGTAASSALAPSTNSHAGAATVPQMPPTQAASSPVHAPAGGAARLADAGVTAPTMGQDAIGQGSAPGGRPSPLDARAALPAAPSATAAQRAQKTIQQAIAAQYQWRSVVARMRTEIQLFDQRLVGSGLYMQGPAQHGTFRLELRIKTDHAISALLQVCDGRQFWSYRQLSDRRSLEWIDAARVSAALARRGEDRVAGTPAMPTVPTAGLGVGGVPRLLRSMDESFHFRTVNEGRLETLPVWILEGTWKPELLAELLPEQRGAIEAGQAADLRKLPAQVPDRVAVFLGRDDLFPYRLVYYRDHPGEKEWEAAGRAQPSAPMVTLEWFEVRFDVPLDRNQLYYNPGDAKYDDVTGRHLRALGLPLD